jgi:hypothetical protein
MSAIASGFVGNAGEYFVLAELTRRGWTAALTARNNRAFDILLKRNENFTAIRVKAKTSGSTGFQWSAKPDGVLFLDLTQEHDFCVLVDIPEKEDDGPTYYIAPTHVIDGWLQHDIDIFFKQGGAQDNRRRIFHVDDRTALGHGYRQNLAAYKGAWNLLD